MTDSEVKPPTIMSVSLKYGLFYAVIGILLFVIRAVTTTNPFDNRNWFWTLITMGISIAILVLAQREFKNNGDGFMSYGQGFKIAFLAALIGGVITGVFLILYASVIDTGVMDAMYDAQREQMEAQGVPEASIEMGMEWTKKLFWPIYFFMTAFFGVLFAVIITIFTQKKNPDPTI